METLGDGVRRPLAGLEAWMLGCLDAGRIRLDWKKAAWRLGGAGSLDADGEGEGGDDDDDDDDDDGVMVMVMMMM